MANGEWRMANGGEKAAAASGFLYSPFATRHFATLHAARARVYRRKKDLGETYAR
jgi:hypothetical protein